MVPTVPVGTVGFRMLDHEMQVFGGERGRKRVRRELRGP